MYWNNTSKIQVQLVRLQSVEITDYLECPKLCGGVCHVELQLHCSFRQLILLGLQPLTVKRISISTTRCWPAVIMIWVNLFMDWMDPLDCIILYFLLGKNSFCFLMLEITVSQCLCYIRYITTVTTMQETVICDISLVKEK